MKRSLNAAIVISTLTVLLVFFSGMSSMAMARGTSDADSAGRTSAGSVTVASNTAQGKAAADAGQDTFTVVFDPNGGDGAMAPEVFAIGARQALSPNLFERNGYAFAGWNTLPKPDTTDPGTSYIDAEKVIDLASADGGSITLYAVWTPIAYSISYDLSGGTLAADASNPHTYTIEQAFKLANPQKKGYTFAGWTGTDIKKPDTSASVAKGSTGVRSYTATWTPTEYRLTLDPGEGTIDTPTKSVTYDAALGDLPVPERAGYTFTGWRTQKTGGSAITSDTVYRIEGDYTVYAGYTPNSYKVVFDANGGSGTMRDESFSYDVQKALTVNTFKAPEGYRFSSWNTLQKPTAQDQGVSFSDGQEVEDLIAKANGTITLYAIWEEDSDATVTYASADANTGVVDPATETLAKKTGTAKGSTATADPGYHFVSWTDATGTVVSTEPVFIPAKVDGKNVDATYTANFAEDPDVAIGYAPSDPVMGVVSSAAETVPPATGTAAGSTATANLGYHFVSWTDATGTVVSTDPAFIPAKTDGLNVAAAYVANFAEDPDVDIVYTPSDPSMGSVNSESETVPPATGVAAGATAAANPGYHFVNWTDAGWNVVSEDPTFVPGKLGGLNVAATYTANFEADAASLSFDSCGGSAVSGLTGKTGDTITAIWPADPTYPGHTFAGWYTADGSVSGDWGTQVTAYPAVLPAGDTVYYAMWAPVTYRLTFDVNGGSDVDPVCEDAVFGDPFGTLPDTAREGYDFLGWFTQKSGGSQVIDSTSYTDPRDTTLHAHWSPITYTISYDLGTGVSVPEERTSYTVQDAFTLTNPTRAGYLFAGWTGTGLDTSVAPVLKVAVEAGTMGDLAYTAVWTQIDIDATPVVYDGNGADANIPSDTSAYATGDTVVISATVPARTGYDFAGWYLGDTPYVPGDALYAPGDVFTLPEGGAILVAEWSASENIVSFYTGDGGSPIDSQTVLTGDHALQPADDPTRDGYVFSGWFTDTTETTPFMFDTTPITSATTIYAGWTPVSYAIVLNAGADDVNMADGNPACYDVETGTFTLRNPTRADYDFAGWTSGEEASTTMAVTVPTGSHGDLVVTAVWTPAVHTVSFSTVTPGEIPSEQVAEGSRAVEPSAIPVRTGYTFTGWFADYACTVPFDFTVGITKNTTVYAGWTANDPVPVQVPVAASGSAATTTLPKTGDRLFGSWGIAFMLILAAGGSLAYAGSSARLRKRHRS